jgi:hypothetical protein
MVVRPQIQADRGKRLKIGLDENAFARDLAREIATPGVKPVDSIERLLSQHLARSLKTALGARVIKEPTPRICAGYSKNHWATLFSLAADGYETWYPELQFSTKPSDVVEKIDIEPAGFLLEPIDYGFGVTRKYNLKINTLKTQTNHILKLNHLKIGRSVFDRTLKIVETEFQLEQPYLANPGPQLIENGREVVVARNEFVAFDHIINGSRVFCNCARPAHDKIRASAVDVSSEYVPNSWPHQVIRFLSNPTYLESICHLCISASLGPEGAADRYGDAMQEFVEPYVNQLMRSRDLDERTARTEVQQQLGLSRWVREAEMYQVIKQIFPDDLVLREASPPWLGRQRLDVFLPQRNLALEYQGEQHYQAVSVFGGSDALARTIERDALKKRLCEENSVELIYVRFSDPLSITSLRHRLRQFL